MGVVLGGVGDCVVVGVVGRSVVVGVGFFGSRVHVVVVYRGIVVLVTDVPVADVDVTVVVVGLGEMVGPWRS